MWVLVIMCFLGASSSLTNVPGFASEQQCIDAGEKVKKSNESYRASIHTSCLFAPQLQ